MEQTRWRSRRWAPLLVCLIALLAACGDAEPQPSERFSSPERAAEAVIDALASDDVEALLAILGPAYRDQLVTSDWDAEREVRQKIVEAARVKLEFDPMDDGALELVLGENQWPFPILLVSDGSEWYFDTDEGIEEILDRRIGRNELSAIALCHAYVDAQIEYARADRDGDDVLEYAQRLASSPGQMDGLYWEADDDDELSPFGPLVRGAERYLDTLEPGDPIRGYYFQVLTRQGGNPPGGAYDYIINGSMLAGFALVAYPADYGNTGIMTFVVNHQGRIYQKDLGAYNGMDAYNPDDTWTRVENGSSPPDGSSSPE
jgi:hypothetical protein